MANKPRTQAKPITQHQLFPAVVALWFGALFGLGSLAVRPSLIEGWVIASRIDLLIPAAAPPLGITARILIALALAAIGSVIGIAITRRITRPKPEVRERKRNAFAPEPNRSVRPAYASAEAVIDEKEPVNPDGILAARRRSLALEEEEVNFVPYEFAPLPGGAPQILDICAVGFGPDPVTAPQADEIRPEPVAFDPAPAVESCAPAVAPAQFDDHSEAAAEAAAAAADGRQVFGQPVQEPTAPVPRQIFGQPIENDHVSPDFVKAAGYNASVFEAPAAEPLFPVAPEIPAFTVPEAQIPPAPAIEPEAPAQPVSVAPARSVPVGLGMDDLASRLAESMARRRAARSAQAEPEVSEPAAVASDAPVPQAYTASVPEFSINALPPLPAMPEPLPTEPIAPQLSANALPQFSSTPLVPVAASEVPSALRPLDLDGFEEEADDFASLLPPRKIAFAPPVAEAAPAPLALEPAPEEPEVASEEMTEENYASLLGIAPQATAPSLSVRIEEPEAENAAIEPVVIFPGQMARFGTVNDPVPFRRFDAPGDAGPGQAVAASEFAPAVDREESEKALRLALSNLQRMSGAA